jgi:NDP-sugar pyrophosphorylase family protein
VTLAVREYEWRNPFGVVELLEGRVVGIKEKPISVSTISVGMYVLNPAVLREIGNHEKYDMPQLLERLIRKEMRIVPFPVYESWADIANYEDLNLANSPLPTGEVKQ